MARDWYWTAKIPLATLRGEADALPTMVEALLGSPPFLGARETETAWELSFEPEAAREALSAAICGADEGVTPDSIAWEQTAVKPWLEDYWNRLKPLAVGERLQIIPREGLEPEPGRLPIHLEPGMAFGTGDHFTTGYCLARTEWAAKEFAPGSRVLDLGTGSGILAIGAARLGFTNLEACDVDPLSIEEAGKNCARNGIATDPAAVPAGGGIWLHLGSIHACAGPYDVIIANLFADLLRAIEPELRARVRAGGALILSGISEENLPKVTSTFTPAAGWSVVNEERGTGWCGVTLRRV